MKNLTIAQRLAIGFTILVLLNLAAAAISLWGMRDIKVGIQRISTDSIPSLKITGEIQKNTLL